jgi:rod shape-determining protein MreC
MLVLLSIVLMTLDQKLGQMERLRAALSLIVYPVQYLVNLPAEIGEWINVSLVTRRTLMVENSRLREQNLLLKSRSQRFASLEAENMRLRELLESSVDVGQRVLVADVIAVELEPNARQVVLNKGSQQGVYQGQPIIDANGVMGQVVHVNPVSCIGMLITDSSHALPVQINRNGIRAVANGTGEGNSLELAYVPVNADVREGDLIVSSGMDGRFPTGYPVGEIKGVTVAPGEPFAKVTAVPSAQFNSAREVLLVWSQDATAAAPTANADPASLVAR